MYYYTNLKPGENSTHQNPIPPIVELPSGIINITHDSFEQCLCSNQYTERNLPPPSTR